MSRARVFFWLHVCQGVFISFMAPWVTLHLMTQETHFLQFTDKKDLFAKDIVKQARINK